MRSIDLTLTFPAGAPTVESCSPRGRAFLVAQAGVGCTGMTLDGVASIAGFVRAAQTDGLAVAIYGEAVAHPAGGVQFVRCFDLEGDDFLPVVLSLAGGSVAHGWQLSLLGSGSFFAEQLAKRETPGYAFAVAREAQL